MSNNSVQAFSQLEFADAQVLEVLASKGLLTVRYLDWQEKEHTLIFDDVCGVELFSIEGEDLSHGTVDASDQLIERASKISKDKIEGLRCFCLWSAWSDEPLMRVVARGVRLKDNSEAVAE